MEPPTEAHHSHNSCQVSVADDGRDEPFRLADSEDDQLDHSQHAAQVGVERSSLIQQQTS